MSEYMEEIKYYGEDAIDTEISAFESVNMLHQRSWLQENIHNLSEEESELLRENDRKLLANAKNMFEHIRRIYDFSARSTERLEEWWWHLDMVVDGRLKVSLERTDE
ncbi:hypothetical protein [Bacillus cereus group sp. TH152-1LC]|uniref:hypothetical protein n=1 Tax=Bacillus cereus group sp. TH152-1LC TaxID=3018060 RepID=UPI0022E2717C|nr:hypothetical protein [Bacillus cereus group sp. TH152-1LC]MDA1675408.1 hypothetical protein [Bacillus cereus group sp. TH152-1LC]